MKHPWAMFTVLLGAALAAWFLPSMLGGKVLLPLDLMAHNPPHEPQADAYVHNHLIGDMLYESLQWKLLQRRALAGGELPLWNPYSFCGHPLYTTGQASTFYPLNVVFLVLPAPQAFVWFTWLHLLLGGVFTYALCRRLGIGSFGAAVGGICLAMGGFLVGRIVFPMLLASAIWLPLMLLWLDVMTDAASLRYRRHGMLAGPILFAMPILGGFYEIAFYAYAACGLFTLVRCLQLWTRTRSLRDSAVFAGKAAAAVALGVVLAAPQILPFFEVMKRNVRAGEGDYAAAQANAVKPQELLTTLVPDALGNPTTREVFNPVSRSREPVAGSFYFGPLNYVEACFYFGVLPFAFLLMSIRAPGGQRLFFSLLLVTGLAFAFVTPVYKLFYYTVPGAEQVRTPFRWMYVTLFAGACLAAVGAQHWFEQLGRDRTSRSRWLAWAAGALPILLGAAVVIFVIVPGPLASIASSLIKSNPRAAAAFGAPSQLAGLLWMNGARLAVFSLAAATLIAAAYLRRWSTQSIGLLGGCALLLIVIDLGQATFPFNTQSDPTILHQRPAVVAIMQEDHDLFRIGRYGPDKVLYSNLPAFYGLQDYGGYDSIILSDYADFVGAIEAHRLIMYNIIMTFETPEALDSPLLPLLNIRYMLTGGRIEHADWEQVPVEGNVGLYRVRPERELPRAFLVSSLRSAGSVDDAITILKSGEVDVWTTAVVEGQGFPISDFRFPIHGEEPSAFETGNRQTEVDDNRSLQQARVEILEYRPSSVRLRTTTAEPAFLVLLDVFYPGWNAYVNGVRTDSWRTNAVFRGVAVPAGTHEVEFRFQPVPFRIGAIAALVTLLILIVATIHLRFTRGRTAPQQSAPADTPLEGAPPGDNMHPNE